MLMSASGPRRVVGSSVRFSSAISAVLSALASKLHRRSRDRRGNAPRDNLNGMHSKALSRRDYLSLMSAGASLAAAARPPAALAAGTAEDRARRMQWWHQAKFGMFIHWGLYSVWGRHEWAMEQEAIPVSEYE